MKNILIIVGPTAVGKTSLALEVAAAFKAEIISADSRQIYRYMDIGTAKPTIAERRRVFHHFVDIRNPDEEYSAGDFGNEARARIKKLQAQNRIPIVVGGAGFYLRALVDGLGSPKIGDPVIKQKLKMRLNTEGLAALRAELEKVDPVSVQLIHPNDWHRTLRALEVYQITRIPFSTFRNQPGNPADFQPHFIGLTRERQSLYRIIEQRVDEMIKQGLIEEVVKLKQLGYPPELNALQTVGYREVLDYLGEKLSYDEMVDAIKKNTRHYAKRQLTWFQSDSRIHWINIDDYPETELLIKSVVEDSEKIGLA